MATKAKNFEQRFKQDWMTYCPDSFCYRLNDQVSGYKGTSANISDFICYKYPLDYVIDCKSHKGNTISFRWVVLIIFKVVPSSILCSSFGKISLFNKW